MKKRVRKLILLTGMLCAMSLVVCACGDTKGESADVADLEAQPQDENEPALNEDSETEAFMAEPETDEKTPDVDEETKSSEDKTDTDETQDIKPDMESVSGTWTDSTPNLEGSIKDIQAGQFTVIEAITEKSDNGWDMIALPSDGDDSEFNKVTVTYDENTLFAVKTIYDGGARSEMTEATSSSLATDQLVEVWGDSSGSELKATQICIVKVI
ncbi:MAG: hypothetical protein HDR06_18275 [Lachnospiraceae bacterium]|nr:hypothetical protein [Lachnospiraceae bacterium]